MSEIVLHQSTIGEQMEFARAVVHRPEGAARSLLPDSYRDNPGNVLIAVGLGQSMGLSPAESLYRIDVIQGKPTAGAELIAANVRKAGHKLRVQGDEQSCTATIIRADDPDFPFTVTRDLEWAQKMGLTSKDNYKKQPGTMLQWRAISAVARLACPEALYGVAYTADEMFDSPPPANGPASGGLGAALSVTAEQIPDPSAAPDKPAGDEAAADEPPRVTKAQLQKIGAGMRELGITVRADALVYVNDVIGRQVESRNDLTKHEASLVIESLERDQTPTPDPSDPEDPWRVPGGEQP